MVMGFYTTIGLIEFYKLTTPLRNFVLPTIIGLIGYSLIGLSGLQYIDLKFNLLILPLIFILMAAELFSSRGSWQNLSFYLTSFAYIVVPFSLMNSMFYVNTSSPDSLLLMSLFFLVWTSDVFAYLTGSFFGKHKLFERISPKKTWEGTMGGLVFALVAAYIFYSFTGSFSLLIWMEYTVLIVVSAVVGDLAESMLKRNFGVKDSGTIFPGHGGVLDRFDAVLFATPFAFVFFNFVM
jgi:phosphatidate cytidylyltransferase